MPALTLFHTAKAHVATFNALAPQADLAHVVRPDWLARAQGGIDAALEHEIKTTLQAARTPVLCSCTTIGEIAEAAGATRIDWPMMTLAAQTGGPVLLAYCLDSTLSPSSALLRRAFAQSEHPADISPLDLTSSWPLYTTGATAPFAAAITAAIATRLEQHPETRAVILAQASMAPAAPGLRALTDMPVFTSPDTALRALLPAHLIKTDH